MGQNFSIVFMVGPDIVECEFWAFLELLFRNGSSGMQC